MAFLAVRELFAGELRAAFVWLFAAVVIDATDGTLARRARVHERLPHFSGEKVDDLVDYLTFVFVPALIIWPEGLLPPGWPAAVVAGIPVCAPSAFASDAAEAAG